MDMIRKILEIGNSLGVTIDTKLVSILDLKPGQIVKVSIELIDETETK
jgi:antitoxin component of MazEF toxin-antitoxin module